jgi:hypothetical protein
MTEAELEKINSIPLNFVIGKERSGTTLLQVMLNAHPNIVAPPESRLIALHYRHFSKIVRWTEKHIDDYCKDLFREILFKDHWNVNREDLKADLISLKDKLNYPLVCKIVFYHYAPKDKDIKMFVDKNPIYYNVLPELKAIFPEARYINIVRDYHANIESQRHIASLNLSTADMAYRWLRVSMMTEEARKKSPGKWMMMKYEDLVLDAGGTMKKICQFLHLPFDEKMTEAHNAKLYPSFYEHKEVEKFKKFHNKLFEPINSAYIDSWKNKLTEKEISIAETIAARYGEETYGYKRYIDPQKLGINGLTKLKVRVKYKIIARFFRSVLLNRKLYMTIRGILVNLKSDKG